MKTYCISGMSTGATWGYQVDDLIAGTTPVIVAGLSVPGGQPASALRDTFVGSLGGHEAVSPYLFARVTNDPACPLPDAAFFISMQNDFNLVVTASGTGTPTIVGPAVAVSFNPDIIQLPEPGSGAMLWAGAGALLALRRRRGR